jgi:Predicted membrane protein
MPFPLSPRVGFPRNRAACRGGAWLGAVLLGSIRLFATTPPATDPALAKFQEQVQPILDQYCYDCHGYGSDKGGVVLDGFADDAALRDHKLWLRVLKNVRAKIMPPADEAQPEPEELEQLVHWIKRDAFGLDPRVPDPGRVTVRRLNRVEYRNTIRDLMGVDYNTKDEFPADDTGHGFDNIGDVLTISPMLMEKYIDAAQTIVERAVPMQSKVAAQRRIAGVDFARVEPLALPEGFAPGSTEPVSLASMKKGEVPKEAIRPLPQRIAGKALDLYYYTPVRVASEHRVARAGTYRLELNLKTVERYVDDVFDYNRCRLVFKVDGETLHEQEFTRQGEKMFNLTFERAWTEGAHELAVEIYPTGEDKPQPRLLRVRLEGLTVRGPMAEEHWVRPDNYARFFVGQPTADEAGKREFARSTLARFATKAFRRPVDEPTIERLVDIAESTYSEPNTTVEAGVAQAMVAVLASPRFIFREEEVEPLQPGQGHPFVDEYALASRLSYFLWSTMPDDELMELAAKKQLRANLGTQLERMLKDGRAKEFVRNFAGQWLQARDITSVVINSLDIYLRENPNPDFEKARETFRRLVTVPDEQRTEEDKAAMAEARKAFISVVRKPRPDLTDGIREAMLQETERYFEYIIQQDRALTELIDSNYTFLNEELAKHYDIEGVTGDEMRRVELPSGHPRGGVLTQGTVLAVTSNPTRTSPVKRGVFILEAILGTPPAPPPPNIPALEDVASAEEIAQMSLRETMDLHARNKMCASCHSRMDPLGLALENFNAMGKWRVEEMNQPIDTAGKLITGEAFKDVRDLKRILATEHREDFYHSFAEKLLTYALGRGVEYYDSDTLDQLVARLEASGGKPSALLRGIVESAPFQQRRQTEPLHALHSAPAVAASRLTQNAHTTHE